MSRFYSQLGTIVLALLFVVTIGCKPNSSPEDASNDGVIVSGINYSMAQPIKLESLKTKKDFLDFCENNEIAVVKFTATWCGPCKALEPELEKMAGYFETQGVKIAEVDVDDLKDLSNEMHISSIPHTFVFYNGQPYADIMGFNPGAIASLIDSVCQNQEAASISGTDNTDWTDEAISDAEREDRAANVDDSGSEPVANAEEESVPVDEE
jgi:thiol-disulfide isomerase/thioredoxin